MISLASGMQPPLLQRRSCDAEPMMRFLSGKFMNRAPGPVPYLFLSLMSFDNFDVTC
jgi:hypothetical protein